jgi:integrase
LRQRIDRGEDPLADKQAASEPETAPATVGSVIDDYLRRYADRARSRASYREYERVLHDRVKPLLGGVRMTELKRSHIVAALDEIEDERGAVTADRALTYLRACLNWYASRVDDFTPPFVKGMARTKPAERARDRVLSDDEIRAVWQAADRDGTFGAFVKMLLLTGQRKSEVAGARRSEFDGDVWTIPAERAKLKKRLVVPVSQAVLDIVAAQPPGEVVFASSRSGGPISGWGKRTDALRAAAGIEHWNLHDLRRTARTLLVRAGVRPDIAERCIGHELRGVVKIYDRHDYMPEMRQAFAALAGFVERIVNPPTENVVAIRG